MKETKIPVFTTDASFYNWYNSKENKENKDYGFDIVVLDDEVTR